MLELVSRKTVVERRSELTIYKYTLNLKAIKFFELGGFFLLSFAALVYPLTQFTHYGWVLLQLSFLVSALAVFGLTQYWRSFARSAFVAYDDEALFIADGWKRCFRIPWKSLDLQNSGLGNVDTGGTLLMNFEGKKLKLRLFTGFVAIIAFEKILSEMLTQIKKNLSKTA